MEQEATAEKLITNIAGGLAGRLRLLVRVLDRLDRLESGSGEWKASFAETELSEAATSLTLRALSTMADSTNFTILNTLATNDGLLAMKKLMEKTGIGRLVLSERLNDLMQVGLATRLIDTDQAQITGAGANIVRLVEMITHAVAEKYESVDLSQRGINHV